MQREISLDAAYELEQIGRAGQATTPVDNMIASDETRRVRLALENLLEPLREVLVLRSWKRQSYSEIAGQLGGTAESVRTLWGRAVRRLRSELRKSS